MKFTYDSYFEHIALLRAYGYRIIGYPDGGGFDQPGLHAILRHDVDFDLGKAYDFARREEEQQVSATYFVLLRSDFYNLFSPENRKRLRVIAEMGHAVGLHFDEKNYDLGDDREALEQAVAWEKHLLEQVIEQPVPAVSMHRPSRFTLEGNFRFPDLKNSYSFQFMKLYKYLSDSRMHWREDLRIAVESGKYDKLHILTHPFWYGVAEEGAREKLLRFAQGANRERYRIMSNNFRDLGEFVGTEDLR